MNILIVIDCCKVDCKTAQMTIFHSLEISDIINENLRKNYKS